MVATAAGIIAESVAELPTTRPPVKVCMHAVPDGPHLSAPVGHPSVPRSQPAALYPVMMRFVEENTPGGPSWIQPFANAWAKPFPFGSVTVCVTLVGTPSELDVPPMLR